MELRKLPLEDGQRVETGPVQFGNDWPGVFIRGDECCAYSFMMLQLGELKRVLESADIRNFERKESHGQEICL